ncbi:E3 ubiquitin-protein ligase itt1 [Leucoagaricus sp. SymC.cos]|nr:E3 ubiquitin-protein ligase itt1 [Leucoagaricus sp. SymC.cos]
MQRTEQFTEIQQEEILALQSIYPDWVVISSKKQPVLIFEIPVELPESVNVIISSQGKDRTQVEDTTISCFPPITVTVSLPPEYPEQKSASIEHITAKAAWLPALNSEQLEAHLIGLWQPGSQVLYEWLECICCGRFLAELGLLSSDNVLRLQHASPRILSLQLAIHAQQVRAQQFSQATYDCSICLTSRKGSLCIQLSGCNHIFCRACLNDFWASAITDGNLSRVGCAEVECVKAKREAKVDDVRAVFNVSPHHTSPPADKPIEVEDGGRWFVKWMRMREQRDLARDRHVAYCPVCQEGVRRPPEAEDEASGWSRYRICPACKFSFCKVCRKTWHGPQNVCQLTEEQLIRYIRDPKDNYGEPTSWMRNMEKEYGVDNVKKQVGDFSPGYLQREKAKETGEDRALDRYYNTFMEEVADYHGKPPVWNQRIKANEAWILKNTVPCPECRAPTVRDPPWGCNQVGLCLTLRGVYS